MARYPGPASPCFAFPCTDGERDALYTLHLFKGDSSGGGGGGGVCPVPLTSHSFLPFREVVRKITGPGQEIYIRGEDRFIWRLCDIEGE